MQKLGIDISTRCGMNRFVGLNDFCIARSSVR